MGAGDTTSPREGGGWGGFGTLFGGIRNVEYRLPACLLLPSPLEFPSPLHRVLSLSPHPHVHRLPFLGGMFMRVFSCVFVIWAIVS